MDGWKTIGSIQVNANKRLACYYASYNKTSNSDVTLTTFDSAYKPNIPVIGVAHANNNVRYVIDYNGTIKLVGNTGSCNVGVIWKY